MRPLDFSPRDRRTLQRRLGKAGFGRRLRWFEQVTSTNDLAWSWAAHGAPEGAVVLARAQEAGRGRDGRSWVSAAGSGLWLSIVLRPGLTHPAAGMLPLSLGFGLTAALRRLGLPARLKWPNDVLIDGRKVAGILVEARSSRHTGTLETAVAGIGVNWLPPPDPDLAAVAGALAPAWAAAEAPAPDPLDLLAEVLVAVERAYLLLRWCGPEPFVRAWPRVSAHFARTVEVRLPAPGGGTGCRGLAGRLRPDGGLELLLLEGQRWVVHAGEVRLVVPPGLSEAYRNP